MYDVYIDTRSISLQVSGVCSDVRMCIHVDPHKHGVRASDGRWSIIQLGSSCCGWQHNDETLRGSVRNATGMHER